MKSIDQLKNEIAQLEAERSSIFEKIHPLQEQATKLFSEIKAVNEKLTVAILASELTEQERFDFIMYQNGVSIDSNRHDEARKFITELGLYMLGYNPFSNQNMSSVFIYRHGKNTKTIESIKKLAQLYKPMDEEGNIVFPVFCTDHSILAKSDGTFSLTVGKFVKDFDILEELFAYYERNHTCYDDDDFGN